MGNSSEKNLPCVTPGGLCSWTSRTKLLRVLENKNPKPLSKPIIPQVQRHEGFDFSHRTRLDRKEIEVFYFLIIL